MPWTKDLEALEERFRRRMLALYVVVVITLAVLVGSVQWYNIQREDAREAFRKQLTNVCYTTQRNVLTQNATIDQLIESVRTSKTLTQEEKAERIAVYRGLQGEAPECPPR